MTLQDIPEFPELVGNYGTMASEGANMLAGDDIWIIIAIYVFEHN